MTLIVRPDLRLITRAPNGTSIDEIEAFLARKWRWLEKQLTELRRYRKSHPEKLYVAGESFFYLGRQYMLFVEAGADTARLERGKIRLYTTKGVRNTAWNKLLFEKWLGECRERVFKQEYIAAYRAFGYGRIPRLKIRIMSRRWGSCSADGKTISLNPKLIQASRESIRYVCIHELCHVTNKKHDDEFYKTMTAMLPNWREIKERLEIRYG